MYTHTLKNGKTVKYNFDLAPNGSRFYIETILTKQEQKELKNDFNTDFDVVSITFNN